jgi:hypothetical protein
MKLRSLLTIGLMAVVVLISCAPVASPTPGQPVKTVQPTLQKSQQTVPPSPSATAVQSQATLAEIQPTQAPSEAPQIVATSRGPDLEAADPATVSMASGELQLVEFFRFT